MSDDDVHAQELKLARRLESQGDWQAALGVYTRVEAFDEAARVLLGRREYVRAGEVLLTGLGEKAHQLAQASADGKRRAKKAAVCFSSGGQGKRAAELLLALGDLPGAAEALERAGEHAEAARLRREITSEKQQKLGRAAAAGERGLSPEDLERAGQLESALHGYAGRKDFTSAARVALKLQKPLEAAKFLVDASLHFEAASCFLKGGDEKGALDALTRVGSEHPKYREACSTAIRLAVRARDIGFQTDYFLADFLRSGPASAKEAEEFYALGRLYKERDFAEQAVDVFRTLLAKFPGFRDTEAQMREFASHGPSASIAERLRVEDEAYRKNANPIHRAASFARAEAAGEHNTGGLPPLPELPPLSAPPAGVRAAPPSGVEATMTGGAPPAARRPAAVGAASPVTPEPAVIHADNLAPGTAIAGRYRIGRQLGKGGMGAVYEAEDLELGERIALKFFYGEATGEMMERFRRELALSRKLSHPNIVKVFDIGSFAGAKFMSMELLTGHDLSHAMAGGLSLEKGMGYLAQACRGLAFAHTEGVVHRDVKPENFFVTEQDVVKVMDFGIAKQRHAPGLTQTGFLAGTPGYIAPEQINAFGKVDHKADLYAIGVIAFQMFTGQMPFDHEELMPLLMMHVNDPPPRPRAIKPEIPADLETLILSLLAKAPDDRPASATVVAETLERRVDGLRRAREALKGF